MAERGGQMILVYPAQMFGVFTFIWVALITFLWIRHEYKKKSLDWTTTKEQLYSCSKCHYSFLAKDDSRNITRCPRCNEMCFLKKKKFF